MKQKIPGSVTPEVRAWFGNQIQALAMRHDLIGPDINRANIEQYTKQLIDQLGSRARAAISDQELCVAMDDLDKYCRVAAEELVELRQTRSAHKDRELPTEALQKLPAYAAFPAYFDEAPGLVYAEAIGAAQDLIKSRKQDASSAPMSKPSHPAHPVSKATRAWMELQAFGLACADDASGAPFGTVPQDDYVADSAIRIRENARRAIGIGDLRVPAEDVDKICWVAACEAYLLRSLKAARDSGELSYEEIKQMPIYGPYHAYFETGSELAAMAKALAASAGLPIPPDTRN